MKQNMQKHVRIISILLIVLGIIYLLVAGFACIFGLMAINNQAQDGGVFLLPTMLTGGVILFPLVLLGVLHILIARAFREDKGWSRIGLWILAILNLANVPLGTGLGIYAMWVLMKTREGAT
ncbi:MAG: hypothetical protein KAI39_11580 [Desulfobulbaceae bacterium]|nr:hypothetical protein [Desulfobulbaceae bacterium]